MYVCALLASGLAAVRGAAQDALAVTTGPGRSGYLAPDAALELRLSRPLVPADGRLAVFIGASDVSVLFETDGERVRYLRKLPLPAGQTELVVYTVSPAQVWQEVGRFALHVLTRAGFEKAEARPTLALTNKGQVVEGHAPSENRPLRPEFQDFGMNAGLQTEHVRGGWTVRTQANVQGVSNREEALRFGERQDDAPRVDLSDYLVTIQRGRATISAGNISFGNHKHVSQSFDSRGLQASFRIGSMASLSLTGLSGSRLVGWGNPFGIASPDHRMLGGSLGLELIPRVPGSLQLEVSALDGAALPQAGFNQGAVVDAEQSRGAGLRLSASDAAQRLRLEAGYARTRFSNPFDATLAQGATVVAVRPTTRDARYVDATWNAMRAVALAPSWPVSLAITLRHERVDPLYRSMAAPQIRADLAQDGIELTAALGSLNAQVQHSRGRDNLEDIPTLLTTLTRSSTLNLSLPLAPALGAPQSTWLPALTYALTRVHQFGDSVPTLGGFTPTFVPDQLSTNHALAVTWQATRWRATYQLGRSFQDNRQTGRERADLGNRTHTVSVGVTPLTALDITLDGAHERAHNHEFAQRNTSQRLGTMLSWRFTATSALQANVTHTRVTDEPRTAEQSNTDLRLELSQRISLFRARTGRPPAQLFVRYARLDNGRLLPRAPSDTRRNWSLNTGFTLSLF